VTGQEDAVGLLLEFPSAQKDTGTARAGALSAVRQRRLQSPLTPLHWAAERGHDRCVQMLLAVDEWRLAADRPTSEQRDLGDFSASSGTTPLMLAARAGSCDVLRQIVNAAGDLLVVDRQDCDGACGWHSIRQICHSTFTADRYVEQRNHGEMQPRQRSLSN